MPFRGSAYPESQKRHVVSLAMQHVTTVAALQAHELRENRLGSWALYGQAVADVEGLCFAVEPCYRGKVL